MKDIENIILITIDALRADHLSCYGYKRNTSPTIDRLAREGIIFKKAIASAPYTTASITSLQTSTYPLTRGGDYTDLSTRTTLAETLNKEGFSTIGVHSNPFFSLYNYSKGFEIFTDPLITGVRRKSVAKIKKIFTRYTKKDSLFYNIIKNAYDVFREKKIVPPYSSADRINEEVISSLENRLKKRFYLWIHYMDVHEPYIPKKIFFGEKIPKEKIKELMDKTIHDPNSLSLKGRKKIIDLYDNEIRCVNEKIRELMEKLEKLCDLKKTLLIITADHGQALGEREYYGHGGRNMPINFFDELIHIPLIFWSKSKDILTRISNEREFKTQVGLIDIAPTLMDILDIEKSSDFMGNSVSKNSSKTTVLSQGIQCTYPNQKKSFKNGITLHCYRTDRYKLICKGKKMELYDLKEDPREIRDISSERMGKVEKLRKELLKKLEDLETGKKLEIEKIKIGGKIEQLKKQGKL